MKNTIITLAVHACVLNLCSRGQNSLFCMSMLPSRRLTPAVSTWSFPVQKNHLFPSLLRLAAAFSLIKTIMKSEGVC